jgi:hypothetical protein
MVAIMGDLHVLPTDLPVLSKPDRFRKASEVAVQLWRDEYRAGEGGIKSLRAWLDRCAALQSMLPALRTELAAMERQATRSEIAAALTTLREVLPTGNRTPTAAANKMMAERVGSTEPSIGVLNFAVLRLIDTLEWFPPPAKVLDMLSETSSKLKCVAHAIERIPQQQLEVAARLVEAEREQAAYYERRAAQATFERSLVVRS